MGEYDPSNSKCSEERMEEWRQRVVDGNMTTDCIPGVGEATITKLTDAGYDNTFKLIGAFLGFMGEGQGVMEAAQAFKDFLGEHETPAGFRDTVTTAVVEKVMVGCRMPMIMDEARLSSSRMDHAKMEAFLTKELTGVTDKDFSGISAAASEKLKANAGVDTTWQFFGLALQSADADEFEDQIKGAGVAGGWSATVVHQVVEKLAAGFVLPYT